MSYILFLSPFLSPLTAPAVLMNLHYSFNRNPCLLVGSAALRHQCTHHHTVKTCLYTVLQALAQMHLHRKHTVCE